MDLNNKRLKNSFLWSILAVVTVFPMGLLLLQIRNLPRPAAVKAAYRSSHLVVLDRAGLVLDQVAHKNGVLGPVRQLQWITLDKVPEHLARILIQSEDRRFYFHPGIDPVAHVRRLLFRWVGGFDSSSATLTEKLLDRIEGEEQSRGYVRVLKALAMEMSWRKGQILEAYLNLSSYREGLQGIAAASYSVFDKSPDELSLAESALLMAMMKTPKASLQQVRGRACYLLQTQKPEDPCIELSARKLAHLEETFRVRPYIRLAPEVAEQLAHEKDLKGRAVARSFLDRRLQWLALRALQKQSTQLASEGVTEGGALVLENATGQVLAYVNSARASAQDTDRLGVRVFDAVRAYRPVGPMLAPFLYGRAFEERVLTAATLLENPALVIASPGLSNEAHAPLTTLTARAALAGGMTLPSERVRELLGIEAFVETLMRAGFGGSRIALTYSLLMAAGTVDASLLELANAFRMIANDGQWTPVRLSPDLPTEKAPQQVLSKAAAFLVKDILSDASARALAFGKNSPLTTKYWTAVKSGSGTHYGDYWTVGFSERYTVAVWMGNHERDLAWSPSEVKGSGPVWREIMDHLHARESSLPPRPPEGVNRFSGEWFIEGTNPARVLASQVEPISSRFSYPLNGVIVDLDTDLTRGGQPLMIMIMAPQPDQNVYINGRRLGRAQHYLPWAAQPGAVTMELRDSFGRVLDKVRFKVRGGRLAMATTK